MSSLSDAKVYKAFDEVVVQFYEEAEVTSMQSR